MKTASQKITRNPGGSLSNTYVMIEKIVLGVLKRFRFMEVGVVTAVDPKIARVKCHLVYQDRESKWLKIYMPFASRREGIWAMPNVGDHGLVFFMLGDLNSGLFFNGTWGGDIEAPVAGTSPSAKDILIKRNGSWFRVKPNGDLQGKHRDGNEFEVTKGFVRTQTNDGQKSVNQKYHIADRRSGTDDPFTALAFSKKEARNATSATIFRRKLEEPKGGVNSTHCLVDGISSEYVSPVSSANETVRQDRMYRYTDLGGSRAKDGTPLEAMTVTRTTEFHNIPRGQDLALTDDAQNIGTVGAESSHQLWLGEKAFAWLQIAIWEQGNQRHAEFKVQLMADGHVEDFNLKVTPASPPVDVSIIQAFMRAVRANQDELLETDGVSFSDYDIQDGSIVRKNMPFVWPLIGAIDPVYGEFGMRMHPIHKVERMHNGIDISGNTGDPIKAAADGTVTRAEVAPGYGNLVVISHGEGIQTYYGHLDAIAVKPGQDVVQGQVIGTCGSTGLSTEPHLHFEVRVYGVPKNPREYLP